MFHICSGETRGRRPRRAPAMWVTRQGGARGQWDRVPRRAPDEAGRPLAIGVAGRPIGGLRAWGWTVSLGALDCIGPPAHNGLRFGRRGWGPGTAGGPHAARPLAASPAPPITGFVSDVEVGGQACRTGSSSRNCICAGLPQVIFSWHFTTEIFSEPIPWTIKSTPLPAKNFRPWITFIGTQVIIRYLDLYSYPGSLTMQRTVN